MCDTPIRENDALNEYVASVGATGSDGQIDPYANQYDFPHAHETGHDDYDDGDIQLHNDHTLRPAETTMQQPKPVPQQRAFDATSIASSYSGASVQHPAKCICNICICGKHKCHIKAGMRHVDPDHFKTSKQSDYVAHALTPRQAASPRPAAGVRHVDPDHFKTSKQDDYKQMPKEAYNVHREAPPQQARGPRHVDPDHFKTSKQSDYVAHALTPRQAASPRPAAGVRHV
eukprot:PhM_4_TR17765/c1_g1_i1/m.830